MEDRSIVDNVLLVNEIIHHMRGKSKGKIGEMALKMDISKAFDLFCLLRKRGFHEK